MNQLRRSDTISSESSTEIVTKTVNTANVRSKIFEAVVQRGQVVIVENRTLTKAGVKQGVALVFDPRKSDGSSIARSSRVYLSVQKAGGEFETFIRRVPVAPYTQMSLNDQRSEDFKARLAEAFDINTDGLRLLEGTKIQFQLESSEVIDWSQSYLELPVAIENQ